MPAKDDGVRYTLRLESVVIANDCNAPKSEYWVSFHAAAEELCGAFAGAQALPDDLEEAWDTPLFDAMRASYEAQFARASSRDGALRVMRQYRALKHCGAFQCAPIVLLSSGDGQTKTAEDAHALEIDGTTWHYAKLDGNHRLMTAHFLGFSNVDVMLKSKTR